MKSLRCLKLPVLLTQASLAVVAVIMCSHYSGMAHDSFISRDSSIAEKSVTDPDVKRKPSASDVQFTTIEKGTKSGIKSAERVTVTEDEEWLTLWRRHKAGNLEGGTTPKIDFERYMVIAIFQGEGSEEGGLVEIERIKLLPDKMVVYIAQSDANGGPNPQEGARSTTSAYHIVKVTKNSLPVVFN